MRSLIFCVRLRKGTPARLRRRNPSRVTGETNGPSTFVSMSEIANSTRDYEPLVSVVMPVKNGMPYLAEAVESILAQTLSDFEFIIVDDGSTDETTLILESFAAEDGRIRVCPAKGAGLVDALNTGVAAVRGKYIARMDADDVARSDRFAKQVAFLESHPDHAAVATGTLLIDPSGNPIEEIAEALDHDDVLARLLRGYTVLCHPTVLLRTQAVQESGAYSKNHECSEDYELYLRLSDRWKLAVLGETLMHYRIHLASVTNQYRDLQLSRKRQALEEAWERRGLPAAELDYALPSDPPTQIQLRRRWIRKAFRSGYYATAWKHSRCLLREEPLSRENWGLAIRSLVCYATGRTVKLKLEATPLDKASARF